VTWCYHHVTVIPALLLILTTIGNIIGHLALARVVNLSSHNRIRTGLILLAGRGRR
jgi:hypothetical protein